MHAFRALLDDCAVLGRVVGLVAELACRRPSATPLAEVAAGVIGLGLAIIVAALTPDPEPLASPFLPVPGLPERLYNTYGLDLYTEILRNGSLQNKMLAYRILMIMADHLPRDLIQRKSELDFEELIGAVVAAEGSEAHGLRLTLYALVKRHAKAFEKTLPGFPQAISRLITALLAESKQIPEITVKQLRDDKAALQGKRHFV